MVHCIALRDGAPHVRLHGSLHGCSVSYDAGMLRAVIDLGPLLTSLAGSLYSLSPGLFAGEGPSRGAFWGNPSVWDLYCRLGHSSDHLALALG